MSTTQTYQYPKTLPVVLGIEPQVMYTGLRGNTFGRAVGQQNFAISAVADVEQARLFARRNMQNMQPGTFLFGQFYGEAR